MEDIRRIRPELIARVSDTDEVAAAPLPSALWVAKESSFKALNSTHPVRLISELRIFDWKVEGDQLKFQVYFQDSKLCTGDGFIRQDGHLILGIYLSHY